MTDNKFEPGQLVLVRDADNDIWQLAHYDYLRESGMHGVIGGFGWIQCIPLNEETKHLHRTSQPYEPPKPPVEYEWGQKVKVLISGEWDKGLYIGCIPISLKHRVYTNKHGDRLFSYTEIHPLNDPAAH